MSKAVDDILGFLRTEHLSDEDQAELIQRLRDGEGDNHKPAGQWVITGLNGALYSAEEAPAHVSWVHGPDVDPDDGLEITFYHGQMDGKPVIQIDGSADFRVNVNDCPVWDQHTDQDYEIPVELRESLETRQRMLAKAETIKAGKRVWVGVIRDFEGAWIYVGATERALLADMRSNYSMVEWREESTREWTRRVEDIGATVTYDSYYVEGED